MKKKLTLLTTSALATMLVSGSLLTAPLVHADSNSSNLDGVKITRVAHKDVLDIQIPVSVLKRAGLDADKVPQDSNYQVNLGNDGHDTTVASGTTQTSDNGQNMVISMNTDLATDGDFADVPLTITVNDNKGHQIAQVKNIKMGDLAALASSAQTGSDVKIDHNSNDDDDSGYSQTTIRDNGRNVKVSDIDAHGMRQTSRNSNNSSYDNDDEGSDVTINDDANSQGQGDTGQRSSNVVDDDADNSGSQNTQPGGFVKGHKEKDPNDGEEYITPNTRNAGGNGEAHSVNTNGGGSDSQGQGDTGQRSANQPANSSNGNNGSNNGSNGGANSQGQGDTGQQIGNQNGQSQNGNGDGQNTLPQTGMSVFSNVLSTVGAGLLAMFGVVKKLFA